MYDVPYIAGATLKRVVEFLYQRVIDFNDANVDEFFSAASFLQIPDLQARCIKFYKTMLRADNCLGIWEFADKCSPELKKLAADFTYRNFKDVVHCEEFTQLSSDHLREILESDQLQVDTEEEVFHALMGWIRFDAKRKSCFQSLFKTVRLQYINITVSLVLMAGMIILN